MADQPKITQEMIALYDEYTHLTLDRRGFMDKLARLTGSVAAASTILPLISANAARAAVVAEDDARVTTSRVTFPGKDGEVRAYLAVPKNAEGKRGAVMVIHENRGLNGYIEDVTRRLATAGFIGFAPDLLSPMGGTPNDEDKARAMIAELPPAQALANAVAGVAYLKAQPGANGKVGAVGFCWGGGMVNQLATASQDLTAASVFYGAAPPDLAAVQHIKARLLLNYAGLDDRINATRPAYEEALKKAGVKYESFTYEGVNHAFHNDTSSARFDAKAAELAWERTLGMFREALG